MGIYKEFKNLDDCLSHVILNMAMSDDNKYMGIRTQGGVIFFEACDEDGKTVFSIVNYTDVPHNLLVKLELEIGLVSTKVTNIRKIETR